MSGLKRLLLSTLMFMMITSSCVFAASSMVVNGDNVRVRKTPTTSSNDNIIGKVNRGNVCTIISQKGDWYEVSVGNIEGYIRSDFLSPMANAMNNNAKSKTQNSASSNIATQNSVTIDSDVAVTATYIYNKNKGKIHYSNCRYVKQMNEGNKVPYNSLSKLYEDHPNASPCKGCNP